MKALIVGVLGQDGSYLAELLASKGYEVYGVIKWYSDRMQWLEKLVPGIKWVIMDILNPSEWITTLSSINPDEVYNFAGVTNVFDPWSDIDQTFKLNAQAPQIMLESIRKVNKTIRFFQASSCFIFGKDTSGIQNEETPTCPVLPYGAAKLYADNMVKEYRSAFGMHCCSGIFFNHESPRRGNGFFTKKITNTIKKIKTGEETNLTVGSLDDFKDYGYAPDYVEAAHLMLTNKYPSDYVIGTGTVISTESFVIKCFERAGLDYKEYLYSDDSLRRKPMNVLCADTAKITSELGWKPKHSVDDLISIMMKDAI